MVYTNGRLLERQMLDRLVKAGVREVRVTLYPPKRRMNADPDPQALVDFVIASARARHAGHIGSVSVTDLRCEYLSNPLGVDVELPRFSWKRSFSQRNKP